MSSRSDASHPVLVTRWQPALLTARAPTASLGSRSFLKALGKRHEGTLGPFAQEGFRWQRHDERGRLSCGRPAALQPCGSSLLIPFFGTRLTRPSGLFLWWLVWAANSVGLWEILLVWLGEGIDGENSQTRTLSLNTLQKIVLWITIMGYQSIFPPFFWRSQCLFIRNASVVKKPLTIWLMNGRVHAKIPVEWRRGHEDSWGHWLSARTKKKPQE